ncbi:MAG: hypothetical protein NDJ92_00250, partial [Thermoanaerobaculia bacterium]|nr:hypothetical protein [Thermoanaerobaculia bacterium]
MSERDNRRTPREKASLAAAGAAAGLALATLALHGLGIAYAASALAFAALAAVLATSRLLRLFSLAIAATGATLLVTAVAVERIDRTFDAASTARLTARAQLVAVRIDSIEQSLGADADRIATGLRGIAASDRLAMFDLLGRELVLPRRGARISASGKLIAWWGDEPRRIGPGSPSFSVTGVQVFETRKVGSGANELEVLVFRRIKNAGTDPATTLLGKPSGWISASAFNDGSTPLPPGSRRFRLGNERRLFLDLTPELKTVVLGEIRAAGRSTAAAIAALAFAALALFFARRDAGAGLPVDALCAAIAIAAVRVALLGVRGGGADDPVFGFESFGSRFAGPFMASPFDLAATALALFWIVFLLARLARTSGNRVLAAMPLVVAVPAAVAFQRLVANITANARVTPLPEKILPSGAAQLLLFLSIVLLGWALVQLARTRFRGVSLAVAAAVPAIAAVVAIALGGRTGGLPLALVFGALAIATLASGGAGSENAGRVVRALLVAPLVYFP